MSDAPTSPFDLSAGVPPIEGELRPKPRSVPRISKRIMGVAFGFGALLLVIFLYSLDQIDSKPRPKEVAPEITAGTAGGPSRKVELAPAELTGIDPSKVAAEKAGAASGKGDAKPSSLVPTTSPEDLLAKLRESTGVGGSNAPKSGKDAMTGAAKNVSGGGTVDGSNAVPAITGLIPRGADGSGGSVGSVGAGAPLTPEEQGKLKARQARESRMQQARAGGLSSRAFETGGATTPAANATLDGLKSALTQAAKGQAGVPDQRKGQADGEQEQKLDFVRNAAKEVAGYHPFGPMAALSKNEIKQGAFIPLILQQGINSDLPGQITARVSEGVYDTIDGCRLLVPAMSTAVGKYDSKVALGQNRILVVWTGLVFPDGAELNLAGMQSYDMSGVTGLQSEVDNHYFRLFGVALGMSFVTGAVQAAVAPPPAATTANGVAAPPTFAQSVATALAQQYGQLGAQILGKYAAVQPTLKNYAGERFVIMVPRTIVFTKVWANRCVGTR